MLSILMMMLLAGRAAAVDDVHVSADVKCNSWITAAIGADNTGSGSLSKSEFLTFTQSITNPNYVGPYFRQFETYAELPYSVKVINTILSCQGDQRCEELSLLGFNTTEETAYKNYFCDMITLIVNNVPTPAPTNKPSAAPSTSVPTLAPSTGAPNTSAPFSYYRLFTPKLGKSSKGAKSGKSSSVKSGKASAITSPSPPPVAIVETPKPSSTTVAPTTAPTTAAPTTISPTSAPQLPTSTWYETSQLVETSCVELCYPVVAMEGDDAVYFAENEYIQFLTYDDESGEFITVSTIYDANFSASTVSISGNTTAIGDPDNEKVHVYQKNSSGQWNKVDDLPTPPDIVEGSLFGSTVAVEDDVMAVGATQARNGTGVVYVYRQDEDQWVQEAALLAVDPHESPYEEFGNAVSIEGGLIALGDMYYGQYNEGGVYVYEYQSEGQNWTLVGDPIVNPDCELGYFGADLVLLESNGALLTTCSRESDKRGAIYYYTRDDETGQYVLTQKIQASGLQPGDQFGGGLYGEVDATDNLMVTGIVSGNLVSIFTILNGEWIEVDKIDASALSGTEGTLDGTIFLPGNREIVVSGNKIIVAGASNAFVYTLPIIEGEN